MAVKILSSVAHSGHRQCGLPLTSTNESPDVQDTDQSEASMSPIVSNQRPLGDEILDTLIPSLSPFIQSRGWMSVRLFSKGLGAASHCWLCLLYLIPTQRPGNDMQAPAAFLAQCLLSLTLSLSPKFESEQSSNRCCGEQNSDSN